MSLGKAQTAKFLIGTAELRVGPLSKAGALTASHSVGLIDNAIIEFAQSSVDLEAGFPKKILDTAIISQAGSVKSALREYSRRNLKIMLGSGQDETVLVDVANTMPITGGPTVLAAGTFSVPLVSATGFTAGDTIVIYPDGSPESITVATILSIATNTLTLATTTPLTVAYTYGASLPVIRVYKSHTLPIGDVQTTQYMTASLLTLERDTGRPVGYDFWKVAVGGAFSMQLGGDTFGSTDLTLKLLEPVVSDYTGSGLLLNAAALIAANPVGRRYAGV